MLISQFAREAGLTPDTVRFYIRRGLLDPARGERGGSARYQVFSQEDLQTARIIRLAQSLGFTLREIATIKAEFGGDGAPIERRIEILQDRLRDLDEKAAQIAAVSAYLQQKMTWLRGGCAGPEPPFASDPRGGNENTIITCVTDFKKPGNVAKRRRSLQLSL